MFQRVKNVGWLGAEEVARLGLGFLLTLLLANHLGPSGFGAYGYLFGFVALFTPFVGFGLDPLITKRAVEHPESLGTLLQVALVLRTGGAIFGFLCAIALMSILPVPEGTSPMLAAIAGISLLMMPGLTPNVIFKALERVRIVAIPRMLVTITFAGAMLYLVLQGKPMQDFVLLRAVEATCFALVAMFALLLVRPGGISLKPSFDRRLAAEMIKNGFPLMLSGLAGLIYMRIDQVMIGQVAGVQELGRYTVAVRFSDAALFVPMAIQAAFFPALVRASRRGDDEYKRELKHFFDIMSLSMWTVAVGVIIAGCSIIWLVLDPVYSGSALMLLVLSIGLPFVALGVARSSHLTIRNWFWTSTIMTAAGGVLNVVLNALLIPKMGGTGAALASVFSYWLAAHGMCYALSWTRELGRDVFSSLNPTAAATRLYVSYKSRQIEGPADAE